MKKKLLVFGNGYSCKALSKQASLLGYNVFIVSRNPDRNQIKEVNYINFKDLKLVNLLIRKSIIVSTVPPDKNGFDPVLSEYG
jgi:lactate dehydrogenase-like 2-hydroxyacid dehydrogenase